ncbi:HK97 family phage prohead protease [Lactococcus taiwanensis]|uniref:HK97 family phage prohead protease n=1 Tax=Lactococcus taiwanensis TaxID=1151742 RepID=UPI001965ADCD|nr:HK97 family phage prohead protease [Lactococcus taiwanensis]QRZ11732.1 HK97 family phage prohead protease [Lactococcus taiwanensis]
MKLVNNSAEIKTVENEDGSMQITAVAAEVGVVNRNGMILRPNSLQTDRERYPLLYNHGEMVIGDCGLTYDEIGNKYITDMNVYDTNPSIRKAVENGAFNSVSVAYYLTDYDFNDYGDIVVNAAILKEISLVSVPADPNANFIENAFSEDLLKERTEHLNSLKTIENELMEIKKRYE